VLASAAQLWGTKRNAIARPAARQTARREAKAAEAAQQPVSGYPNGRSDLRIRQESAIVPTSRIACIHHHEIKLSKVGSANHRPEPRSILSDAFLRHRGSRSGRRRFNHQIVGGTIA